ncbi:MAG: hypothetical protein R3314_02930 [Longimicrobiales bacterium]|nr:hypothetical protein [Longimicrobiales bacterium]
MRAAYSIAFLTLLLVFPGCENGPPWAGGGASEEEAVTPDFGPIAAYNRRLIFLGPGGTLPTAAVFDFVALSDSVGIRRGVRARVVDGARWRELLDAGWEMEPMREPWRLVPHGPLKLVVSDAGDLGTLIHRDSVTTRLQLGATLAEHSPDVGTQLVLRSARLSLDDETVAGILLDAQLGRAVSPSLAGRPAGTANDTVDTIPTDPEAGADPGQTNADTTADTSADPTVSPTPIALPGAEALLLNNAGYYTVIAPASTGSLAWVRNAGQNDVQEARLAPTSWTASPETGLRIPSAWRVVSASGDLSGELTAEATDRIVLGEPGAPAAMAYAVVSGWIEDRTARRNVFGLVRHVW